MPCVSSAFLDRSSKKGPCRQPAPRDERYRLAGGLAAFRLDPSVGPFLALPTPLFMDWKSPARNVTDQRKSVFTVLQYEFCIGMMKIVESPGFTLAAGP